MTQKLVYAVSEHDEQIGEFHLSFKAISDWRVDHIINTVELTGPGVREYFGDDPKLGTALDRARKMARRLDAERKRADETQTLECGCVVGKRRTERMCRYHQSEDDAIYAANERRRFYDPLPAVDNA